MPICCAVNCHFKPQRGNGRTFHKFPFSKPSQLKQWVVNIKRDKWSPKKTSVICSDHFEDKCFDRTGQTTRLRENATPTIFNFPPHLAKRVKERRPPKQRETNYFQESTLDEPQLQTEDYNEINETDTKATSAVPIDHQYQGSPSKVKRKLTEMSEKCGHLQKRLKISQQKVRRLKKKVMSVSEILDSLKKNDMITSSAEDILKSSFSGAPLALFTRMWENNNNEEENRSYSPVLKSFAMTLQFYSSKGYDFVRKTFDLALPSPSTIRGWYSKINGDAGFCEMVFTSLKERVANASLKNEKVVCSLMIDEMSIRKHVEWDGKRARGYVDIGSGIEEDELPVATEALVFMIVSLNSSWKVPLGYFLVAGFSGKERANLVNDCLIRLHETGIMVTSLTCDGPSCHFTMAKCLGADFSFPNPKVWFPHPVDKSLKIYIILDVCHMLKLVRNTWDALKILKDKDGNEIKWQFITALHKIQEEEGLRAGTRLRKAHIEWKKQKMKVNLAAQTISSSVADAIEFCNKDLKLVEFNGSEATVQFIRNIDRLFDLLNSRNPCAKGFKSPMKKINECHWKPFLDKTMQYILDLTDLYGNPIYQTKKKTGYVGFYISAKSIQDLFFDLVKSPNACLRYLLTYKFSQDHLELFFCAVRARGGWNNNPTVRQFSAAFKRLLMRNQIVCAGNVKAQDETKILALKLSSNTSSLSTDTLDISLTRKYGLDIAPDALTDHDYSSIPDIDRLSLYIENVVSYVAGYVVIMVERVIHCEHCIAALQSNEDRSCLALLMRKTRGGLIKVSNDVLDVCLCTEKCIKRVLNETGQKLPQSSGVDKAICNIVLQEVNNRGTPVFSSLREHMLDSSPDCNHVFRLIKTIASCFLKIRFHHIARRQTESVSGSSIRKTLSKLILFKNQ